MQKLILWIAVLFLGIGIGIAYAEDGRFSNRQSSSGIRRPYPPFPKPLCGTVNGIAELKEGGQSGQKAQYWINGFPGKTPSCSYTLELCFEGNTQEIGAKTFMTTVEGVGLQSWDNIVNCNKGWSHFFNGFAAGAQEIVVGIDGGYSLRARFTGKSIFGER